MTTTIDVKDVLIAAGFETGKATREEINALTRTELLEALEDIGCDPKTTRRMRQPQMAEALLTAMQAAKLINEPEEEVTPEGEPKAKKAKKAKEGQACTCGCGGTTKGGRYLPGHDAKHHAQMNGGSKKAPKACFCGCGEMTAGGTFRPGHDARYYSRLHKTAQIGLDIAVGHVGKPAFLPETINPAEVALIVNQEVAA